MHSAFPTSTWAYGTMILLAAQVQATLARLSWPPNRVPVPQVPRGGTLNGLDSRKVSVLDSKATSNAG